MAILLCFLAFSVPVTAQCAPAPPILILFDEANYPLMYAGTDGQPAGLYPAILREAIKRAAVNVTLGTSPWGRALWSLENGKTALGGAYPNARRLSRWRASRPLYAERIMAVTRNDTQLAPASIYDLQNLRICVVENWSYGDQLDALRAQPGWRFDAAPSEAHCLRKLATNRVDVALIAHINYPALTDDAMREQQRLFDINLAMTTHIFWPNHTPTATITRIDMALEDMIKDGTLEDIILTHLQDVPPRPLQ